MGKWRVMAVLGAAQFLMVLDTSVMNVSISQLVADLDTDVTHIQIAISMFTLVMAGLMITGGKLGDRWGRKRAFAIGLVIYAAGSGITAISPNVYVLYFGWSLLEGIGSALILPALAALIGENYRGKDRALAYAVIGGVAAAGVAVGPIIGGWVTTNLTWRYVFAAEVLVAVVIFIALRSVAETSAPSKEGRFDVPGAVLSASGLVLIVFAILQASTWGWLRPKNSPVEPLGFALTPFVILAGLATLAGFRLWEERVEGRGDQPLVRFELFRIPSLTGGLAMLGVQNLVIGGVFFSVPLFLQVVNGYDALHTGIALLPISITLLLAAMTAPRLAAKASPQRICQAALLLLVVAIVLLLGTLEPKLDTTDLAISLGVMGIGIGLLASQLANVVQSAVGDEARSEVGGLQYTAQNLGSSIGTALIGALLIGGLTAGLGAQLDAAKADAIEPKIRDQVTVALRDGVDFVPASEVGRAAREAGLSEEQAKTAETVYRQEQLDALRAAIGAIGVFVLGGLWLTRRLPTEPLVSAEPGVEPDPAPTPAAT